MKTVCTDSAPQAIGPYSQAVISNNFVFLSGQIALNPEGELIEGSIEDQTHRIMENIGNILQKAGSDMSKVVKTTIFLKDIQDFAKVNEVYGSYFNEGFKPARSTVEVSALPKNVKVEIDLIAEL